MSLYSRFKTDSSEEQRGVRVQYGVNDRTGLPIVVILARAGGSNTRFSKVWERLTKPYRRQIETETIDPKISADLMRRLYAEAVVLDWENVDNADGEELPFSVDNCVKIFEDLPDWFDDIRKVSGDMAVFRSATVEADAKN